MFLTFEWCYLCNDGFWTNAHAFTYNIHAQMAVNKLTYCNYLYGYVQTQLKANIPVIL